MYIEQFSIGSRKTETKVVTLPNHNRCRQSNELIIIIADAKSRKTRAKDTTGFGFTCDLFTAEIKSSFIFRLANLNNNSQFCKQEASL